MSPGRRSCRCGPGPTHSPSLRGAPPCPLEPTRSPPAGVACAACVASELEATRGPEARHEGEERLCVACVACATSQQGGKLGSGCGGTVCWRRPAAAPRAGYGCAGVPGDDTGDTGVLGAALSIDGGHRTATQADLAGDTGDTRAVLARLQDDPRPADRARLAG